MSDFKSNIGISGTGEEIDWRSINKERKADPIFSALIKEANALFMDENTKIELNESFNHLHIYVDSFNNFLKEQKIKFSFNLSIKVEETKKSKGKEKKLTSKEITLKKIKDDNIKKGMNSCIGSLIITNHYPSVLKNPVEAFFNIIYWSLYLLSNKKANIDSSYYFDCSISLYKAIEDSKKFLDDNIIDESYILLKKIEEIIYASKKDKLLNFYLNNLKFILDCFWTTNKPKAISLYPEQKDIVRLISSNLDKKLFILYEMPPANGKTMLSAIIAKVISYQNVKNLELNPNYQRKTLLYICYSTIVRNDVLELCITQNSDIKCWVANKSVDKEDNKLKTFLRPYKNCYPEWNNKKARAQRSKKEDADYQLTRWKKYSENIHHQWEYYIDDTRTIHDQIRTDANYSNPTNIPQMIISDPDSAYELLKEFPNTFIAYYDEAFAASELPITAKIMSVLDFTVLVSATLAKPNEIPTVINDFRQRHNHTDDSFIHVVKSNKQHISCTFIGPSGNIYAPHDYVDNIESLNDFIELLHQPLIRRAYSPEVVFDISLKIDQHLPENIKFKSIFKHIGMITHESLREYACTILEFICNCDNKQHLFELLKNKPTQQIKNMDIKSMLTYSGIHYSAKTLHVASSELFNNHIENITEPFLLGSPKITDVVTLYEKNYGLLKNELDSINKNGKDKEAEFEKAEVQANMDNLKLEWPPEFILNSKAHSAKFKNLHLNTSSNDNDAVFGNKDDLDEYDETRGKLYLSGIAVHQPETFSRSQNNLFLKNKDNFKFIMSTPSIVYGTNISLSIIDIDKSFLRESTKSTLYQLIGRAGRKGKSNSAMIIFRDINMLNIIFRKDTINTEAQNIESNYANILTNK
jgi:hypothetical protein